MFPVRNFVYLYIFNFVFSMSIETTDDYGHAPYETGCLVESYPCLMIIHFLSSTLSEVNYVSEPSSKTY